MTHSLDTTLREGSELIPGYQLHRHLGKGGAGEVWEVEAPGGIFKAMKIASMQHTSGKFTQRELEGLEKIRNIRHPYLLALDRFEVTEDLLLIVMELAEGNLADRFEECRKEGLSGIPREELLRYISEAAEVLDTLSDEHGLQHLDVKPQNLLLSSRHVKVADFGLVQPSQGGFTATLAFSPGYAPPEVFDNRVEPSTDQYSLAVTYQELLTGLRPYRANNFVELTLMQTEQDPDLSPLPACDQPIVGRALSRDVSLRFSSCTQFACALSVADSQPTLAPQDQRSDSAATDSTITVGASQTIQVGDQESTRLGREDGSALSDKMADRRRDREERSKTSSSESLESMQPPPGKPMQPLRPGGPQGRSGRKRTNPAVWQKTPPPGSFSTPQAASEANSSEASSSEANSTEIRDEVRGKFVASLPPEVYALKLRAFVEAMHAEIIECTQSHTILRFRPRSWLQRRSPKGIYMQLDTSQEVIDQGSSTVEVRIWSTHKDIAGKVLASRGNLLMRCIKAYLLAIESKAAITFEPTIVRQQLWKED